MRQGQLTIIVPVHNEGVNFRPLWKELTSSVSVPFTALVVYDFDEDDTRPVVNEVIAAGEQRIRLVKNSVRPGVVGAIRTGFEETGDGPVLVVMADLSDDLTQVPQMLKLYQQGCDLVAGSRYMKGGQTVGGPWLKQNLSRMAGKSLHWLRGLPTRDATNAFKLYDSRMVRSFRIESRGGFELNLELTVKAFLAGYRIEEVPTVWRDRTAGRSRFRLWGWLPHYLKWYLYAFRPRTVVALERPSESEGFRQA
jgi:glycosyltransferase involved in cell wall biosynthesis